MLLNTDCVEHNSIAWFHRFDPHSSAVLVSSQACFTLLKRFLRNSQDTVQIPACTPMSHTSEDRASSPSGHLSWWCSRRSWICVGVTIQRIVVTLNLFHNFFANVHVIGIHKAGVVVHVQVLRSKPAVSVAKPACDVSHAAVVG